MAINLQVLATKQTSSVRKDILEVAEADVEYMLESIAAQEVEQQKALDNPPTNIIVDGRGNKPIAEVKRSVVVFFANPAMVIAGAKEVFAQLQRLARKRTGATSGKFEVWINNRPVGSNPAYLTPNRLKVTDNVFIVGPMVPFTRKYTYWFSGKKAKSAITIHDTAAKRARGKFKGLIIHEQWVDVRNLNPGGRTPVTRAPAVLIRWRQRGKV